MSLTTAGVGLGQPFGDPDRLLAGYQGGRGATAHAFAGSGYDELVDGTGEIRPTWGELAELVVQRGREGLDQLCEVVRVLVDNDGITDGGDAGSTGVWRLDGIPLLVSASDWETLETGVVQRSRLLDAVLRDLYGEQRSITSGVLPPQLLFGHPGYIRAARGIDNPGRHQLFMLGCDVSRAEDGRFLVNADRTQAPSGAGYALAGRRVIARAIPDIYERIGPRPATPFAQALRLALIDAAPATAEDPVVVVLSPGIYSPTAFDQAYLATVLGFPLVESEDLVVRDGKLWLRSLGSLKRVDVVLRRVDAEYADPLDLRPDSRLGVVGLVEAQRRGAVTVINTLGSGILESPGVQRFLPDLAELLCGERPLLDRPPMYWAGFDDERSHLLARMSSLMIRSTTDGGTYVGPAMSRAQLEDLSARIDAEPWRWVGQELPQFSHAPTDGDGDGLSAACVGMRLFTVSQRSGYAAMVGGMGYVLAPGATAFQIDTVAAKDIWVRPTARAAEAKQAPAVPFELPAGTKFVSSPRVLADLFWIGRYAERAEHTARLLTVTRDRYHEFHYRPEAAGSDCLPALLSALRETTRIGGGAKTSPADEVATAPHTLRALTVDREQPGALAHSIERLALAARAVRDQMSNDTWMILGGVERELTRAADSDDTPDDTGLARAQRQTLAGMLALSGVTAESMVHDAGWTMMDIGKRIERGLSLAGLLQATLTVARDPEGERTLTESALMVCESSVIYRRLNPGRVSITSVADLVLFDERNPRSLAYQLDRLSRNLHSLPGASGSSRAERAAEELGSRLRRLDPADLEEVDGAGRRVALDRLLGAMVAGLSELADTITATQLSLPGEMQPIWGPDQRRVLP